MRTSLLLVLFVGLAFASNEAFADEATTSRAKTLAAKLAGYKHASLTVPRDSQFYSLHLFSEKQQKSNLEEQSKAKETDRATLALAADPKGRGGGGPTPPRVSYYTIREIGSDYLELVSATEKDHVVVVPLQFIRHIVLPSDAAAKSP